ncbi:hypothetical protein ACHAXS_004248 [Conticribra weissflogii]
MVAAIGIGIFPKIELGLCWQLFWSSSGWGLVFITNVNHCIVVLSLVCRWSFRILLVNAAFLKEGV